ncbi:unnamed protein product [Absidia cylindrospora]
MFTTFKSKFSSFFGKTTNNNITITTITINSNSNINTTTTTTTDSNSNINTTTLTNSNSNSSINTPTPTKIDQGYEMVYQLSQPWSFILFEEWDHVDFQYVGGKFVGVGPLTEG